MHVIVTDQFHLWNDGEYLHGLYLPAEQGNNEQNMYALFLPEHENGEL